MARSRLLYDRIMPWFTTSLDVGFPVPPDTASPYRRRLEEVMWRRKKVLAFSYPPPPSPPPPDPTSRTCSRPPPRRGMVTVLDAPDLLKDFYANVLDWGRTALAVALGDTLYLWKATTDPDRGGVSEVMTAGYGKGPIASVAWDPDGANLAVGLVDSDVQLWDTAHCCLLNTLLGAGHGRVASLHWNGQNILCSGHANGLVVIHDIRTPGGVAGMLRGHRREVCALKWSTCGRELASGGRDKLLYLWDLRMQNNYRHRFGGHQAAVKALAWCPDRSHVLASGSGRTLSVWNTTETAAACSSSVDVGGGSRVSGLAWNHNGRELASAADQMTIWKFPSLMKSGEVFAIAHKSPVLFMAQSPDSCQVATAAANEKLIVWELFGPPQLPPKERTWKPNGGLSSRFCHIRQACYNYSYLSMEKQEL